MPHKLRYYQRDMYRYLVQTQNPKLWVQMRLGKTIPTIRALRDRGAERVLVIAPSSALASWERELRIEGESDLIYLAGTPKQRRKALEKGCRWNLLNDRGVVKRVRKLPDGSKPLRDPLQPIIEGLDEEPWDAVVLDESASMIRYPQTKITRYLLKAFPEVPCRVVMAGRPDPQHKLLPYWTQHAFADGGSWMGCSSYWQFRHRYFVQFGYDWVPRRGVKERLLAAVSEDAFVLQRDDVQLDTPMIEEPRLLELPSDLRDSYTTAERKFVLAQGDEILDQTRFQIVVFGWLRRICCGVLENRTVWKGKMQEVHDLLTGELADEPVVIWFRFNDDLFELVDYLTSGSVNDDEVSWVVGRGKMSAEDQRREFRLFQEGKTRILLCQIACADTGVDLGVASTAIYYSLPTSPLQWIQSKDRILGDLTKTGCLVIPLICKGTVEEDIYHALQHADTSSAAFQRRIYERMKARCKHAG